MIVALVDYGSGNLRSAAKALERAAADSGIDAEIRVTGNYRDLEAASHIVLPGVGAFADCRRGLEALPGMVEALEREVRGRGKPFLGICVGMQLMAESGLEHGTHEGLSWIAGEVRPLAPADASLKIPHMGWNDLVFSRDHPVIAGLGQGSENGKQKGPHVYFVHSYQFVCAAEEDMLATADYAGAVTAMVARGNLVGTQFHPEKSQAAGLRLIANFLKWRP